MERIIYDFNSIVREVVIAKGYLAPIEQITDKSKTTYGIYYSKNRKAFDISEYSLIFDGTTIIDTKEHAWEILRMFEEDAGVQAKLKELGLK